MPPRTRKRRGKDLVAKIDAPEPEKEAGAAVPPEYVESVISDLEHESERRVKKLKRAMGDMRQEFLNHFQVRRPPPPGPPKNTHPNPPSPPRRWSC